ncbi:chorismate-binding protein [Aquiflexum gelatinilyticum]|uniref:chorismate-binding protein n=1 Tax=Aquiflexum gelatinilyticum TaxID=2961943 RepID=UPI002169310E|nr:chorismate-binding protein [Aquiflexum gelatinilyticum]MCS4433562.1 chorismate-binding protein [Aquiflexum gelatinilyticum]
MDIILDTHLKNLEHYLVSLLSKNMEEGNQIAIWRKPKSSFIQILIDKSGITKRVSPQLEDLPAGFIVHPFEDQLDQKAYFLEADSYFKIDISIPFEEQSGALEEVGFSSPIPDLKRKIRKIITAIGAQNEVFQETSKDDFMDLVEKGIRSIEDGKLHKIVPARIKKIKLNPEFDLIKSFNLLVRSYPNAFVNFFHIPEVGTWIGASPEILIQTQGDEFYTMSLAGTQKAHGENPLKSAAWTQKEIEEQALVSRYIVDCFKKIRLREYDEHGPKTVLAGNLLHLRSDFKVNMKSTNFPQLGSVMLQLLHPTSAVCGMPRHKALEFLHKNEPFNRSFYAGFIGPVNVEEETSIYVNLRTARLVQGNAILYAGAGVTEDSIPENEWEETEMKCDIIAKHLN